MKSEDVYKNTELVKENDRGKHENNERHRDNKRGIIYALSMAVIHALGVGAIVGLSVALHFSQDKLAQQVTYQNQLESVYARAYYSLLDGVNDMDTTLAKLTVAKSKEKQESLLYDIWCASTLAEEYLATFGN
ncbi:MAG: germination protein YpeB, partial [Clostridia bacterium]|nr:germination protein YpeB [Clostridia bacterium]